MRGSATQLLSQVGVQLSSCTLRLRRCAIDLGVNAGSSLTSKVATLAVALPQALPALQSRQHSSASAAIASRCFYGSASGASKSSSRSDGSAPSASSSASWEQLLRDGHRVNPCNSPLHPAAAEGVVQLEGGELSVQEAYTPDSQCFGCGPAHPSGLHLQSRRTPGGGLRAAVSIPASYCAFPGIVNGGIVSTLMDCHGNWQAAITLMDKGCLPSPPLTLTASMAVTYKEPTPPDTPLLLVSRVLEVREHQVHGAHKAAVEVEVQLVLPQQGEGDAGVGDTGVGAGEGDAGAVGGGGKVLAVGRGVFKRLGALRAL